VPAQAVRVQPSESRVGEENAKNGRRDGDMIFIVSIMLIHCKSTNSALSILNYKAFFKTQGFFCFMCFSCTNRSMLIKILYKSYEIPALKRDPKMFRLLDKLKYFII